MHVLVSLQLSESERNAREEAKRHEISYQVRPPHGIAGMMFSTHFRGACTEVCDSTLCPILNKSFDPPDYLEPRYNLIHPSDDCTFLPLPSLFPCSRRLERPADSSHRTLFLRSSYRSWDNCLMLVTHYPIIVTHTTQPCHTI